MDKLAKRNVEENGHTIVNMHITDCGVVDSESDVPPPMLLQDFISQVRLEIMPFINRDPENTTEWELGRSAHIENLKERSAHGKQKIHQTVHEANDINRKAATMILPKDDLDED